MSTPNSSFIFDRRRRSIKLCAVFLAILRPAAVVPVFADFLLLPGFAVGEVSPTVDNFAATPGCACCSLSLGFICMILRDLVGGGGSAKSSLVMTDPLGAGRFLPTSTGDTGRYELWDESEPLIDRVAELVFVGSICS